MQRTRKPFSNIKGMVVPIMLLKQFNTESFGKEPKTTFYSE